MREFITAKRGQYSLLPASIEEWLPENHLARFVVEEVDPKSQYNFSDEESRILKTNG